MKQLEELYLQMYDLLYRYAWSMLRDVPRAEEAVQETFRIACGKPESVLESENPKGWLVVTLKGVLKNIRRKDDRENRVFVPLEDTDLPIGEETVALPPELLYQDLAQTEEYALLHAVSQGSTIRELSAQLGVSEDACKKRIQRSRQKLKKKIKNTKPK